MPEPEEVFANVILAGEVKSPKGEGRPPYTITGFGMNTWNAKGGIARVKAWVCFNVLFRNSPLGDHLISAKIENGAGTSTVKTFDRLLTVNVKRRLFDTTGAFCVETNLPPGNYRLCFLVDGLSRAVTALHVEPESWTQTIPEPRTGP